MKRKFADKENWIRVIKKRFKLKYVDNDDFKGYISAIYIDEVTEPLAKEVLGKKLLLADKGYMWMQQFPEGKNYALTTMVNDKKEIIQWYFDICREPKINRKGIPYFDDLYLDIVVLPKGELVILDGDELEEALKDGDIGIEEYKLAWNETKRLVREINEGKNIILNSSNKYLDYIERL
ncbi:DUF402 domain-containing protein [Haloimpatiens lingqiaonensis]|uniref:DUF402 domain-containing protein n=1 Tax=Haloimpatiens lingqiaonensis TaxID=1380675 RepID=UPI0010FE5648|nr:DUF402 domain-containing protein [Haloimpatiens lingqiaonensis]